MSKIPYFSCLRRALKHSSCVNHNRHNFVNTMSYPGAEHQVWSGTVLLLHIFEKVLKIQMLENTNILTIPHMRSLFNCEVGLSDHTIGIGVALAAISHGATIIEKHFTLNRQDGGVDSSFSIEPEEMKILVKESIRTWQSLGKISYGPTESEKDGIKFRRSIYIVEDMDSGEKLTKEKLRIIRPGKGLAPKYYDELLGRKVNQKLKKGTALTWEMLK